jgi:hypothetical protein
MFAFMLGPRFKSLRVMETYVGHRDCIHFVVEYDVNALILLLMIVFKVLNLTAKHVQ